MRIKGAEFIRTVSAVHQAPDDGQYEVVVMGRSNVGKSSFINRLANQRQLARKSSTPGRTTELQYFQIRSEVKNRGDFNFYLVDSPGFGFAKLAKHRKGDLINLLGSYLNERKQIKVIVLLNDCRRLPEDEELSIRDIASDIDCHVLVTVTKIDKLKRSERAAALTKIANAYGLMVEDLVVTGVGEDSTFLERLELLLA